MASSGIDFSILPESWMNCTGFDPIFPSQRIERFVPIPKQGYDTKTPTPFTSPKLGESLFYEARHYTDRALYHLVVGKWMICNRRPTWGLVSYYYSSFFSAQAAIRLRGTFFVKVSYESEVNLPPTHQLDVLNLIKQRFQIRRSSERKGEHRRVWTAFYELYRPLANRTEWARFRPIICVDDEESKLVEMHRRHLLNYVPGHGYPEIRSEADVTEWCGKLSGDLSADLAQNINEDDAQLEVRALLRLSLCLRLFQLIAEKDGAYKIHHGDITDRRRVFIRDSTCPDHFKTRMEKVLTS